MFGLALAAEYGGQGASLYELGLAFQEGGRVLCPTAVYSTLLFAVGLTRLGTDAQQAAYLPRLAAGDLHATTAMWNPSERAESGAERGRRARRRRLRLTGVLSSSRHASVADAILVSADVSGHDDKPAVAGFIVEPGRAGWSAVDRRTIAGERQAWITLDGYVVPDSARLALPAPANADDLRWFATAAVALQCMEMAGGAAAVLDRTVAYIKTREQFNRPIGQFQAAQHHIANMRIALETARLTAAHAVWSAGRGQTPLRAAAIAKMHASEAYKFITLTAHQLHGGMGFVRETDLHLWSERAKVTELQGGTADVAASWLQSALDLA